MDGLRGWDGLCAVVVGLVCVAAHAGEGVEVLSAAAPAEEGRAA